MGLFDRFKSPGRAAQEALRLLEEGIACEQQGRMEDALRLFDAAILLAPDAGRAHFCRGNVLLHQGNAQAALEAYMGALALKPDSAAAHYNMGNALVRLGRREEGVAAYQKALALKPDFADAEVALGGALEDLGHLDAAVAHYRRALEIQPGYAGASGNLGGALTALGRQDEALACYRQAAGIHPDDAEAHNNLGAALRELGRPDDALKSFRKALEIKPDYAEAHSNLGAALQDLGRLDEAVAGYRQAAEIRPDLTALHYNLGNALKDLGQFNDAAASFRQALRIEPDFAEAHNNLGIALERLGKPGEALASFRRALEIKPGYADACLNLGVFLNLSGQFEEAIAHYRRTLEIQPGYAEAHMNLGSALADLGLLDDALASTRRALEIDPDYAQAYNNLLFIHNYMGDQSAAMLLDNARRFGEVAAKKARQHASWPNRPAPGRCLRVGLVSGDLCNHPVGYFLVGVLEALTLQSAGRLELFAYANRSADDETGRRIRACCRGWHSAVGLSDEALARRIRDDGIDILIDLSGHTAHGRLSAFAWKPAPVQASWLGYFATTGVAAMDYFIADPWTLPPSEEANFTEKIWRLPETRLCFTPPGAEVEVTPLPALNKGYVTFGCFNNLTKMNDAVVALWARVLAAVPGSRLFLKSKQIREASVRQGIADRYAAHGIDPGRLILEDYVPRANYLAAYQQVDIGLDPFPYPGGTTTVEALWMGVPVLTLTGERFLSRQGVGLLMNAGLPDWVATDPDDYVARAVSHAGNLQRLAALRNGLRQQVLASPIFDAKRFAQHFETALRDMWREWCSKTRVD